MKFHSLEDEDPLVSLCRMVVDISYEDLPDEIIDHCKRSILDTLAVTIGGSAMEGIPVLVELVKERGGKPESLIPFYGSKVPASEAGLVIGPMSRAMDFGDVHDEASHASEYILPVLLAALGLKRKVTGKEFITSFAVGKEVLVRIGIAVRSLSGGAPTGMGDGHFIFGSVAATAKLLGLSLEELEHAMGIARAMTQPLDAEMYRSATLMTRLHHGFVCQDAINACILAQRGVAAFHREILLGPKGYFGMAKWKTEPDALVRGLGEKWELVDANMKPYPSCKCTHASACAILDLMEELNFKAEDIAGLHFDESTINWLTACLPLDVKWNPQSIPDCQFSMPYIVATAVLDGGVSLSAYSEQARARKDVRELMGRITAEEDSSLPIYTARVHVALTNGRKYSRECLYIKGHSKNPLTTNELISKFEQCVTFSAYKLDEMVVRNLLDTLLNLEGVDNISGALVAPLTPH